MHSYVLGRDASENLGAAYIISSALHTTTSERRGYKWWQLKKISGIKRVSECNLCQFFSNSKNYHSSIAHYKQKKL